MLFRGIKSFIFRWGNLILTRTEWYKSGFVDYSHTKYPDNTWYRIHDERNFQIINLGSSSAKWAFDWKHSGVQGMNWANQPQTLVDDFRLLKNFHSILRHGGRILISIMPFSGLNKKTGLLDTYKYVGTLDWTLLDPVYRDEAIALRESPLRWGKKKALRKIVLHCLGCEKPPLLPNGAMDDHNPMTEEEMYEDAQRMMKGWAKEFGINDFDEPLSEANRQGREIRIKVLRELIDFSSERDYEPIVIILPVAKQLARHFSEAFREKYIYSFLHNVRRDVRTLDYLQDENFQEPDLYFNSICMNKRGREKFTASVCKQIFP